MKCAKATVILSEEEYVIIRVRFTGTEMELYALQARVASLSSVRSSVSQLWAPEPNVILLRPFDVRTKQCRGQSVSMICSFFSPWLKVNQKTE